MQLIPHPNGRHVVAGGKLALERQLVVQCAPAEAGPVQVLGERLAALGAALRTAVPGEDAAGTQIRIHRQDAPPQKAGWYTVAVTPGGIEAVYADGPGLHHAMVTLYHLLRGAYNGGEGLACQTLEDWPRYRHRGQHLDTARHYFPAGEVKRVVEQLSLLKMNVLHWHIADDQAWRLESEAYPLLTKLCGEQYHTREEVRDIVAFAAARGVEIIPEFEIPGHSSAAIAAYPELGCRGRQIQPPTTGGIFPVILCGGKQETYTFIAAILGEICDLFPGPMVHIGGDEAPKSEWEKCPYCAAKMQAEGLAGPEDLQGHMLNFANTILEKRGKQALCWNECLKASNLAAGIAVQYWREGGKEDYCRPALDAGRPFVFSHFSSLYFDYPAAMWNLARVYSYEPGIKKRPPGPGADVLGIESCLWTEYVETPDRLEYMMFPRAVATAEIAWSRQRDYARFRQALAAWYAVFDAYGINAQPLAQAEVGGPKRALEKARFIAGFSRKLAGMAKTSKEMRRGLE